LGQLDDFNGVPFKHSGDGGVVVHAHGDVFVLRTAIDSCIKNVLLSLLEVIGYATSW